MKEKFCFLRCRGRVFFSLLFSILTSVLGCVGAGAQQSSEYVVPVVGNTYVSYNGGENATQTGHRMGVNIGLMEKRGLTLNDNTNEVGTSYIYVCKDERPDIYIDVQGKGKLHVTSGDLNQTFNIDAQSAHPLHLGEILTSADGYLRICFRSVGQGNDILVKNIIIRNTASPPIFLKADFNTYFGLRGPSCHLNYSPSFKGEAEWALISVCVPKAYDQEGSYYMALGFNGGYFGFQNNRKGYRQVLFSVWNAGEDNDDPNAVHHSRQTQVIDKGEGVTARDFGGEGSGKQSFLKLDWLPDSTYTFLLHARRAGYDATDFSAWFYDCVSRRWLYISTLRRPNTRTLLTGLHSFLENFDPRQGDKTRKAYYFDGWAKPAGADWIPLSRAYLTNDDTGNRGQRLDFLGSAEGDRFFLMNGGYFNRPLRIEHNLLLSGQSAAKPAIDLNDFLPAENK